MFQSMKDAARIQKRKNEGGIMGDAEFGEVESEDHTCIEVQRSRRRLFGHRDTE